MNSDENEDDGLSGFNPVTDLVVSLLSLMAVMFAFTADKMHKSGERADAAETKARQLELENDAKLVLAGAKKAALESKEQEYQVLQRKFDALIRKQGDEDLSAVKARQGSFLNQLAASYGTSAETTAAGQYRIRVSQPARILLDTVSQPPADSFVITAVNQLALQRLNFGTQILFATDEAVLSETGMRVILRLGDVIAKSKASIEEIHIEGHADIDTPGARHIDNLDLAGKRAMAVYRLLAKSVDPSSTVMSATSYGHYMPVDRASGAVQFNELLLRNANAEKKKPLNRRIEIRLLYRR